VTLLARYTLSVRHKSEFLAHTFSDPNYPIPPHFHILHRLS